MNIHADLDRLARALKRGNIDEKEHDQLVDDLINEANAHADNHYGLVTHNDKSVDSQFIDWVNGLTE